MISALRKLSADHWSPIALISAPVILLAPIVLGGVLYWGVPLLQFYPWQRLAAEMWRAGQLPLWNSLVGSGAPLAANLQTGAFYPGNLLYLILPTEYAMGYTALFHVILAGLFMYAYLRTLKLSATAATIGALAFELNGFLIARLGFLSVTVTLPWLAAWLWRTERLVVSGESLAVSRSIISNQQSIIGNALWLALVIGLGVLAGHAQTAVYGLILIGVYFVWRLTMVRRSNRIASARRLVILSVSFSLAVSIGLGLAAIQLLPALELTRESQRAGGLDAIKVLTHSYWPPRLLTLLSPDFFGNPAQNNFWGYDNYWENAAYIGVLPLLLALWMILKVLSGWWLGVRKRSRESSFVTPHSSPSVFFTVTVFVSLILAFGWFTPIYIFLFERVPGFDLFQGPARWLVVTIPALCILAAIGAQHWIDRGFSRRAATRLILLGLAVAFAGVAVLFVLSGRAATFGPATLRAGVLLIATGWLFRMRIRDRRPALIVVGVIALDLITAHFTLNPVLPPEIYHAPNPAAQAIAADGAHGRVFYFDADEAAVKFSKYLATDNQFTGYGPSDLAHWLNFRETLLPNVAMIDGVPSANNFDSLIVSRYQNLLDQINAGSNERTGALLDQLNAAYIVSPRSLDLPIVYQTSDVTIYRNDQALPRAWLATRDTDLNRPTRAAAGSSIESLTDSGNTVTIRAASPEAGYLILADTYYPGWRAAVDGTPTPIEIAETAFRAVKLTAGEHTIEFRYEPDSVIIGGAITIGCGLIVLIGLALRRVQA